MTNAVQLSDRAALVVVDVQRGFDDPSWGTRNNARCEANIARILAAWRQAQRPVVFVRHDSKVTGSPLAPGHPGNAFKDVLQGAPNLLVTKSVNSSFYGTPDLHAWLTEQRIDTVVIVGITTNHCCETTARMAGNLGYKVYFALDATHTFDRTGPHGEHLSADALMQATAVNLHEEFATIVNTAQLV